MNKSMMILLATALGLAVIGMAATLCYAVAMWRELHTVIPLAIWVVAWTCGVALAGFMLQKLHMLVGTRPAKPVPCPKCGAATEHGEWNRGWNYLCEQAAGAGGLRCTGCGHIEWDHSDAALRNVWPHWCLPHDASEAEKLAARRRYSSTQAKEELAATLDDFKVSSAALQKFLFEQHGVWLRKAITTATAGTFTRGVAMGNVMALENVDKWLRTYEAVEKAKEKQAEPARQP